MIDTPPRADNQPEREPGCRGATVAVSPLQPKDVLEVSGLERKCYTLPWSATAYATELTNPNAHYLVARGETDDTGERIVGYGGIWVVMDEMHITTLAVDPAARGRRVGERLLTALIEEGIRRGALRATLEVRQSNQIAQNLYRKYGFQDVAIRKAYYSDNGENAIIMWAEDLTLPRYQQMLARFRAQLSESE